MNRIPPKFDTFKGGSIFYDQEQNELDRFIILLVNQIDEWASCKEFYALELPSIHANLVILRAILKDCGGGHNIPLEKVQFWAEKMDEPFTLEGRWGIVPWSDDQKKAWRSVCHQTIKDLNRFIKNRTD